MNWSAWLTPGASSVLVQLCGCILIGSFLLVLAMSGGLIGRGVALVVAPACLAGILIICGMSAKKFDELTRQISLEAAAGAFYTTLLLIGGWAALAHLGYVAWLSPLAFVSALALLLIITIFVVSARKGLLIR